MYPAWQAEVRAAEARVAELKRQEQEQAKANQRAKQHESGEALARNLKAVGIELPAVPEVDEVEFEGYSFRFNGSGVGVFFAGESEGRYNHVKWLDITIPNATDNEKADFASALDHAARRRKNYDKRQQEPDWDAIPAKRQPTLAEQLEQLVRQIAHEELSNDTEH